MSESEIERLTMERDEARLQLAASVNNRRADAIEHEASAEQFRASVREARAATEVIRGERNAQWDKRRATEGERDKYLAAFEGCVADLNAVADRATTAEAERDALRGALGAVLGWQSLAPAHVLAEAREVLALSTPSGTTVEPVGVEFNINDHVWVRLTDVGRTVLADYWRPFCGVAGVLEARERNGWTEFQLWELAHIFGASLPMGSRVPFETTIRFSTPSPRPPTPGTQERK
jgi:hypothetical protein